MKKQLEFTSLEHEITTLIIGKGCSSVSSCAENLYISVYYIKRSKDGFNILTLSPKEGIKVSKVLKKSI